MRAVGGKNSILDISWLRLDIAPWHGDEIIMHSAAQNKILKRGDATEESRGLILNGSWFLHRPGFWKLPHLAEKGYFLST